MDAERLAFAGVIEQRSLLGGGSVRVRDLVSVYLERIERLDPALNAFVSVRGEAALRDADEAQRAIDAGDPRPLLGIPFAIKDEHHVAGDVTSYGTGAANRRAERDDDIVRILREAGAVPIGKTTLPELGMHPFTESGSWGITRNPWDRGRTPGGSSGGSAAAVAAGLSSFATAGDGGGSLRIPASCCNLFGLKVQRGRLATSSHSAGIGDLSVPGVLTRSVADAALLYDLLAADHDPGHLPAAWGTGLSAAVNTEPETLRIAMTFKLGAPVRVRPEVRGIIEGLAQRLRALGHDVTETDVDPGRWGIPFPLLGMRLLMAEAAELDRPERLDRRTRSTLRAASVISPFMVTWALKRQAEITAQTNRAFERYDLILTPTLALPPVEAGKWHGRGLLRTSVGVAGWCPFTSVANFVGNPAASVPAGFTVSGLPVGAQLLAPTNGEPTLVALAAQLERVSTPSPGLRPDLS